MSKQCPTCKKFMWESPDGMTVGCKDHGTWDIYDLQVHEYEKNHYVWYDEFDRPYITDKPATNTVQLSESSEWAG